MKKFQQTAGGLAPAPLSGGQEYIRLDGSAVYRTEQVEDFWEVVGRNTDYVEDPEEALATNYAYAIMSLDSGCAKYRNPEILEGIIEYLKK